MTAINQLSAVSAVVGADQVPIYSSANGDARKASMTVLKSFMLDDFVSDMTQSVEALTDSDLVPIYDATQLASVKVALPLLLAYMQAGLTFPNPSGYTKQNSAPSSNGFSVAITNGSANIWLVLTPTAGFAAGTIVLPALANAADGQEVMVNCTQQINALTIDGNGATVTGEPTIIAADDFFRLKFDTSTDVWYRVG